MLHVTQFLATLAAALFAGAALYINLVEHPARMALDTKSAGLQWAPSYRRATWMQAPLALISVAAGLISWWLGGGVDWASRSPHWRGCSFHSSWHHAHQSRTSGTRARSVL